VFYLAYGSNLHPHRLTRRVPSARFLHVVRLAGLRLAFDKRSRDGSAKCRYVETGSGSDALYAAIYRIDAREKPTLDAIEGLGQGYDETWHRIGVDDKSIDAFAYAAAPSHIDTELRPYEWYREMVLLGAVHHGLPEPCIARIRRVACVPDPEPERVERQNRICAQMRKINATRKGV
jgi:gamma-glutamylcyclotransferase